jgi:hypothetical protein
MADVGHQDGSEYPTIKPHDEGDLLRRADVLAAIQPFLTQPSLATIRATLLRDEVVDAVAEENAIQELYGHWEDIPSRENKGARQRQRYAQLAKKRGVQESWKEGARRDIERFLDLLAAHLPQPEKNSGGVEEAKWPDGQRGERSIAVCPEHGFIDQDHLQWDGKEFHNLCFCGETCEFVSVLPAPSQPQLSDEDRERLNLTAQMCELRVADLEADDSPVSAAHWREAAKHLRKLASQQGEGGDRS